MYDAILFDLDGTLLGLDNDQFVTYYFKALAPKLAPYYPQTDFMTLIGTATEAMIRSDGKQGFLRDVFQQAYDRTSPVKFAELEPVFLSFYENEFNQVAAVSRPLPLAPRVLEAAAAITPRIALATIPIFPRIAIEARLRWGSLEHFPFSLITSFENMHFSKPNPNYFLEIAEKLGVNPEKCLMAGNDHRDDLAAASVGMETFLVSDDPLNSEQELHPPTYSGTLEELQQFLLQLA